MQVDRRTSAGVAGLVALVLCVGGCGSSSTSGVTAAARPGAVVGAGLQGLVLKPLKPAPALALRNYTGSWVSLGSLRGRAVLVTFVYTHCPNLCPTIVANLAAADRRLGAAARRVSIIAVTVDPHRDTRGAIRRFLAARDATGTMDYLVGSGRQLRHVWKAWDVRIDVDTRHVTSGHSAIVYGITASGKVAVVYPSTFSPAQIVHDVPLLLGD